MPLVTCPACDHEQIIPREMMGLEVTCEKCRADYDTGDRPKRRAAARRRRSESAGLRRSGLGLAWPLLALVGSVAGATLAALVGLFCSQYAPVFGDFLTVNFAQPWSPARQALIPIHVFAFGVAGFAVGGGLGALLGLILASLKPPRD